MPTTSQLRTHLANGPAASVVAPLLQTGQDAAVAAIYNDRSGPYKGTIQWAWIERDKFLAAILPLTLTLAAKDATTRDKWDRVLATVRTVAWVDGQAAAQLMGLAQQDGLCDSGTAAAILSRDGSLAEVEWGADVTITPEMVAQAR